MDRKYFVIGGLALLALAFFVGIFQPSGLLTGIGADETGEAACMSVSEVGERCSAAGWDGTWDTVLDCETANDIAGNTCTDYHCLCEEL
ncbi:MAG: hypothetical protein QF475_03650 [Candidatus Undinarchaeales archaeon]|jgi:hypothetical protein|nr:hypothetical protein [Candidatus Undinarchaeales archaeon]